ncbi:MAG: excinuclease ABC subunit UvrC [Clostridia bacterium]|nr:excinuclease ABC subunit UvrC [Clostridia bacterium]
MSSFNIKDELKKLPDKPGVYIMKDEYGNVIYVGKAVALKKRVKQYFQPSLNHTAKVKAMVPRIKEFEYIVTDSELEALILECNLIKKHKPKFNILLKDDKSYPYIKVTMNEDYPRIIMTRRIDKDGAKYFGPYSNVVAVRDTIDLIKKIFPIKTCNKVLPRDIGKDRPCLNFYMHQCLGPCKGDVNKEEYRVLMRDICSFLGGKQEDVVKRLEAQMNAAAEKLEFEKAASIRDKISSLKHIAEKQKVLSTTAQDQDIIAFAKDHTDSCIQVFFIRGGKLIGREHFILEDVADTSDGELMSSFVKQFYSSAAFVPGEIVLQEDIDEIEIIEKWLSDKKASRVHIKVPRRGEKLHLVDMVAKNALIALTQFKNKIKSDEDMVKEGMKVLEDMGRLEAAPQRIEAFDISNTGSTEIVASMVVFEKGRPQNREYRRFKIKSVSCANDYAGMQEVIFRRFKHAQKENSQQNEIEKKFSKLPDIVLVDGGLGHVKAAVQAMKEAGVYIPVLGMVKDDKHKTRGLVSLDESIDLRDKLNALRFITSIQDEAHRFAVEYNKKLRLKRYSGSVLDEIEGIGPKRKKALIRHFGSLAKIKSAGIDELMEAEGISRPLAEKIYEHFR